MALRTKALVDDLWVDVYIDHKGAHVIASNGQNDYYSLIEVEVHVDLDGELHVDVDLNYVDWLASFDLPSVLRVAQNVGWEIAESRTERNLGHGICEIGYCYGCNSYAVAVRGIMPLAERVDGEVFRLSSDDAAELAVAALSE